jgi:hypothetical protein
VTMLRLDRGAGWRGGQAFSAVSSIIGPRRTDAGCCVYYNRDRRLGPGPALQDAHHHQEDQEGRRPVSHVPKKKQPHTAFFFPFPLLPPSPSRHHTRPLLLLLLISPILQPLSISPTITPTLTHSQPRPQSALDRLEFSKPISPPHTHTTTTPSHSHHSPPPAPSGTSTAARPGRLPATTRR